MGQLGLRTAVGWEEEPGTAERRNVSFDINKTSNLMKMLENRNIGSAEVVDRALLRLVFISLTCFDSLSTPVARQCIGCRVEHTFTLPLWYQVWESASDQYLRRATCFIYLHLKQIPFAAAAVILVLHSHIVLFVPPFLPWFIYVRDWEGWRKYKMKT